MFGVSRWTLYRRIGEYDMQHMQRFTDISDDEVDAIVKDNFATITCLVMETLLGSHTYQGILSQLVFAFKEEEFRKVSTESTHCTQHYAGVFSFLDAHILFLGQIHFGILMDIIL